MDMQYTYNALAKITSNLVTIATHFSRLTIIMSETSEGIILLVHLHHNRVSLEIHIGSTLI
jgi:hypothetical protein